MQAASLRGFLVERGRQKFVLATTTGQKQSVDTLKHYVRNMKLPILRICIVVALIACVTWGYTRLLDRRAFTRVAQACSSVQPGAGEDSLKVIAEKVHVEISNKDLPESIRFRSSGFGILCHCVVALKNGAVLRATAPMCIH